jgi:hypothetical protein
MGCIGLEIPHFLTQKRAKTKPLSRQVSCIITRSLYQVNPFFDYLFLPGDVRTPFSFAKEKGVAALSAQDKFFRFPKRCAQRQLSTAPAV